MDIIPAIDIQNGQCVRLYQGDFAQKTVYDPDPVAVAQRWVAQGAHRLHLVDLDGAKAGHPVNTAAILGIVRAVNVPIQLGGGLRTEQAVDAALTLGVSRVILGTAAVRDQQLLGRLVARHGPAIIVGVDARDGRVALEGWTEATGIDATEFVAQIGALGVQRVIYTDIARDGTLTEPNYAATAALVRANGPAIIASGGLSALDQIERLAALGVEGVVIGKALYTGAFDLSAAMAALQRTA